MCSFCWLIDRGCPAAARLSPFFLDLSEFIVDRIVIKSSFRGINSSDSRKSVVFLIYIIMYRETRMNDRDVDRAAPLIPYLGIKNIYPIQFKMNIGIHIKAAGQG